MDKKSFIFAPREEIERRRHELSKLVARDVLERVLQITGASPQTAIPTTISQVVAGLISSARSSAIEREAERRYGPETRGIAAIFSHLWGKERKRRAFIEGEKAKTEAILSAIPTVVGLGSVLFHAFTSSRKKQPQYFMPYYTPEMMYGMGGAAPGYGMGGYGIEEIPKIEYEFESTPPQIQASQQKSASVATIPRRGFFDRLRIGILQASGGSSLKTPWILGAFSGFATPELTKLVEERYKPEIRYASGLPLGLQRIAYRIARPEIKEKIYTPIAGLHSIVDMFHNLQKENVMREMAKQEEELMTQSHVMPPFAHPGMIAGYVPHQMLMSQHMAPMHTEKIEYEMEYTPPQISGIQTTTQK
jgi:hypothetical protein